MLRGAQVFVLVTRFLVTELDFGYGNHTFGYVLVTRLRIWLRFGYALFWLRFWLRFGYDLITIWLRSAQLRAFVTRTRFCYAILVIWLRFGYVFLNLVTFWLRKSSIWLRFGYAPRLPGKILVTAEFGYAMLSSAGGVVKNRFLVTLQLCAYLPRITKKNGYVF